MSIDKQYLTRVDMAGDSQGINITSSSVSKVEIAATSFLTGPPGPDGPAGPPGPPGAAGVVQSIVAGTNTTVDNTDPANPVISSSGAVDSVNSKTGAVVLTQDDIGDGTTNKQYSSTDKTRLATITDANYLNSNTTKAQVGLSNVPNTDFTSAVAANTAKVSFDSTSSAKLTGIEANADVTDATNVAAAGAVMTSGNQSMTGNLTTGQLFKIDATSGNPEFQFTESGTTRSKTYYDTTNNRLTFQNNENNNADAIYFTDHITTTGNIVTGGTVTGTNLSGTNTGDQDLSGLVTKTTTVNGHALSSNVTVSKSDVGLGNVTNDVQLKAADLDTDTSLTANSDTKIASQKAVKTYVDTNDSPQIDGGVSLRSKNLAGWFTKYDAVVKGTGTAKVLVIGDSISSFYGYRSWPGLLHGMFQAHRITKGDGSILGSRFPIIGSSATNTTTTTTAGTYTNTGAGGQGSILTTGQEFTQTFAGDAVTIIYGTGAAAGTGLVSGTISVYDGPSSGTAVATVNANSGTTAYSQLLDVTFGSNTTRTITIKVTGGTGTLIEQIVPHAGTLTQGVDLRTAARFGSTTAYYFPSTATGGTAVTESHALALVKSWQPDLIINALGQNDALETTWATNTQTLYDAIFLAAPNTNILTVMMYSSSNTPARGGWIGSANTIAATYPDKIETLSLPVNIGNIDPLINQFKGDVTFTDGIHPSPFMATAMMLPIASKLMGDSSAVLAYLPLLTADNPDAAFNIASVTTVGSTSFGNGTMRSTLLYGMPSVTVRDASNTKPQIILSSAAFNSVFGTGLPAGPSLSFGDETSTNSYTGDTFLYRKAAGVLSTNNGKLEARKLYRVGSTASSATPTINTDTVDIYKLTAQAVDITSFTTNLSGTPSDGQRLEVHVKGTAARAITWGASFASTTVALPTTTVSTNKLRVLFEWNAVSTVWDCIGVA